MLYLEPATTYSPGLQVATRLPAQVLHSYLHRFCTVQPRRRRMSDQQAPYEPPSVEQIDTDGEPIHTSPGQVVS